MKLAVVVLNYNGVELLRTFLPSIITHTPQASIYVIDNASTDGSLKLLAEFEGVKTIALTHNKGYAGGYNEGLKYIEADVLCLINSDVQVTPHWTESVVQLFEKNILIAAVQPKIKSYTNKNMFEYAGAAGGELDFLGYPYCHGRVFNHIEYDLGQYNLEREVFWTSGACFFVRKSCFDAAQGFDEHFFAHQEEIDLCWRWQLMGKKVYYTPMSEVYHLGGGTLSSSSPQKTFLNFRNNLCMLLKNLPLQEVFFIIFIRLCLDGIAGIKFLIEGKAAHTWAIVRAHFGFYALAKTMWQKRINSTKVVKRSPKSIVVQHFLLRS